MLAKPAFQADPRAARRGAPTCLAVAAVAMALAPAACGGDDDSGDAKRSAGARASTAVGTPEGLLAWISTHRSNAGLSVRPDRGPAALALNADRRFPLASTRKVLVVGALTASDLELSERIPRAKVERFYVPGSDGGAHRRARLDEERPTLRQLALATVEVSDNATADALLDRVGARAVDTWARKQGLSAQDPIYPLFGELAAWTRDPDWAQRSASQRARRAQALARELSPRQVRLPSPAQQRELAASSVAGTPAQWAQLMRHIGDRGDRELVNSLDWPRRRSKQLARRFDRYLSKGGSLAGVITEASYVRPAGVRAGTAVALFLRDLPPAIEQTLAKTSAQQKLIMRLATDRAFLQRARRAIDER